jgi:hypothetical protein
MRKLSIIATFLSFAAVGTLHIAANRHASRNPAANEGFALEVQNLALDSISRVNGFNAVFLRATFNDKYSVDFGKSEPITIARGERKSLAFNTDIKDRWVKDDSMDFKLEIVETASFNKIIVRCAQVAKEMSSYNRSYQCTIPGESTAVLTYRLARKGSAEPVNRVASTK